MAIIQVSYTFRQMVKNQFHKLNQKFEFILASQSPRRHFLLKELGLVFSVTSKNVEESFPSELKKEEIALYLSKLKAKAHAEDINDKTVVIASDTIVWINDHVLNKPLNETDAISMLKELSGKMHEVITAVTLCSKHKMHSFYSLTKVYFKRLSNEEIDYYVNTFKPMDKAGAYGAQEWIGYIGVERIEGSYFNVMGLPVKELYEELLLFCET